MQLLQEIRRNINKQEKHKYLLSVAVAAPTFLVDTSYDVARMNEYVDYVNLMSYDYHFYTKSTPFTGINAPLYASPNQIGYFATLNINYSAYYWHFNGMEKNKIIIGLPTYGHSYTLMNNQNTVIGAPAIGYGRLGILGFVDYKQMCTFVTENKIKPFFDMDSKSPYAVKYSEWVSYDDTVSLTFKTEFIKNNDFGGAMIFSLNMDDHVGVCKKDLPKGTPKRFPLTKN
ncbi:chitinase-3-like protein 2, partial [Agrilus planipennis]|uniref:Chitinase-3-like protein 2 n=1 Tax=Agrilus planipennis TaxID=224129 RepID=A0A1W4XQL0_AGRPL